MELNLFLCLSGALQAFTEAMIITNGGPGYASSTFLLYIIKAAFTYNRYSLAAALSLILLIIILIVTTIQRRIILGKEGNESHAGF